MKRILLFCFLVQCLCGNTQVMEIYKDYEGRFSISSPGKMVKNERAISTELGDINYITHFYQFLDSGAENAMFMISYCDYPPGSIHSDSTSLVEDFYQSTIDAAKLSVEGKLQYLDKISYHQFPGRIWRITYNGGNAVIKTKSYLIKNRLYIIQVAAARDKSLNERADDFLESFRLLDGE